MPRFIPYNQDQLGLIAINLADQLQPGTFEYALNYLVENKLDLSIFHSHYKNDATGRIAYDPAVLLKIILFAYSKGITSSREIQHCCMYHILFKALSCDTVPHFTTIADFVSRHPAKMESLFEQVLLICDQQGLLGNELFAIDGCKLPSNAAKEWSGTLADLDKKRTKIKKLVQHHLTEHQRLDALNASVDARTGVNTNTDTDTQQARHQQSIDTLNNAFDKVDRFLTSASPRMGKGLRKKEVKSNITDNESAKMHTSKGTIQGYNGVATADQKHQVVVHAQAFGEGQEQHTLKPVLNALDARYRQLNINSGLLKSDAVITADTGFACEQNMAWLFNQGINAYVPDHQFRQRDAKFVGYKGNHGKRRPRPKTGKVIYHHEDFRFDPVQETCVCPAGKTLSKTKGIREVKGRHYMGFQGRKSQCMDCEQQAKCMRKPVKERGRQIVFPVRVEKKPSYTDWMRERIDSVHGKFVYGQRMAVIEPVFGNITSSKRLNRFSLRGRDKVNGQWQLFCLIHNIEKLANYGRLEAA